MTSPDKQFIRELEVFRTETEVGAQFLYAYLSFSSIVSEKRKTYNEVNKTPLFWNTIMDSLQISFFVVLSRIFDQSSKHNIDKLVKTAQDNKEIFSKGALAKRKTEQSDNANEWIDDYLKSVYEPTAKDFRELRKKVKEFRKIYESNYRDIRNKIYAHKRVSDAEEMQKLFSKTNIRDLQKIFVFVNALYEALWHLLYNGHKPVLQRMRYSVSNIRSDRKPESQSQTVQERMVGEVSDFLKSLTSNAQHGAG